MPLKPAKLCLRSCLPVLVVAAALTSGRLASALVLTPAATIGDVPNVLALAFSPNGQLYALCGEDPPDRVLVFDKNYDLVTRFGYDGPAPGEFEGATTLAFSPDGRLYVGDLSRVHIFDASNVLVETILIPPAGLNGYLTFDALGRLYVSDASNHSVHVFDQANTYLTSIGSAGIDSGQLDEPHGLTFDSSGNLLVGDLSNHRIEVFDAAYDFVMSFGGFGTGPGEFNHPMAMVFDPAGVLFVADQTNHRIQVFEPSLQFMTTFGTLGSGDAEFDSPTDLVVGPDDRLYVADHGNHRVQVLNIRSDLSIGDFLRGDANNDGFTDIGDVVAIGHVSRGGGTDCPIALDIDDSDSVNDDDFNLLFDYLFRDGSPPAAPFPACGSAPESFLGCAAEPPCPDPGPRLEDSRFKIEIVGPGLVTTDAEPGAEVSFEAKVLLCNAKALSAWSFGIAATNCRIVGVEKGEAVAQLELANLVKDFHAEVTAEQDGCVTAVLLKTFEDSFAALPSSGDECECTRPNEVLKITCITTVPEGVSTSTLEVFPVPGPSSGLPVESVCVTKDSAAVYAPYWSAGSVGVSRRAKPDEFRFRLGLEGVTGEGQPSGGAPCLYVQEEGSLDAFVACGETIDLNLVAHLFATRTGVTEWVNVIAVDGEVAELGSPCQEDPLPCFAETVFGPGGGSVGQAAVGVLSSSTRPPSGSPLAGCPQPPGLYAAVDLNTNNKGAMDGLQNALGAGRTDLFDFFAQVEPPAGADINQVHFFFENGLQNAEVLANVVRVDGALLGVEHGLALGETTLSIQRVIELEPGTSATTTLTPAFRRRVFGLSGLPAGRGLNLKLTDESGPDSGNATSLYFAWGRVPSPTRFDFAAATPGRAEQNLSIAPTREEPAWILIEATEFRDGSTSVTLSAEIVDLQLTSMSSNINGRGGSGRICASIRGIGFADNTSFRLLSQTDDSEILARGVEIVSDQRADVFFNMATASLGTYTLVAQKQVGETILTAELLDPFNLVQTRLGAVLTVQLFGVPITRYDRTYSLDLTYANIGDLEMTAPFLKVEALGDSGTEFRLAGEFAEDEVFVLGTHPGGFLGVLAAGTEVDTSIVFRSRSCLDCDISFLVSVLEPGVTDRIPWSDLPRPAGMTVDDWELVRPRLEEKLGTTWQEYHEQLAALATRLSQVGVDDSPLRSVTRLFRQCVEDILCPPGSTECDESRLPTEAIRPPDELFTPYADWNLQIVSAFDPNEKGGNGRSEGGGIADNAVSPGEVLAYSLYFENLPGASAPAQRVEVVDWLDPALFDLSQLQIGDVRIGDVEVVFPDCGGAEGPLAPVSCAQTLPQNTNCLNAAAAGDGPCGLLEWPFTLAQQDPVTLDFVTEVDVDFTVTVEWKPECQRECAPRRSCQLDCGMDLDCLLDCSASEECAQVCQDFVDCLDNCQLEPECDPSCVAEKDLVKVTFLFETQGVAGPFDGFLLPNDELHQGEGQIRFSTTSKPGILDEMEMAENIELENEAEITFDNFIAIRTNSWTNILTAEVPSEVPAFPVPRNGREIVDLTPVLQWEFQGRADVEYLVFLWPQGEARPATELGSTDISFFQVNEPLTAGLTYNWQVIARAGLQDVEGSVWTFSIQPGVPFRRGDADGNGELSIGDPINTLAYLFLGAFVPTCLDALDFDDTGVINLTDAISSLSFQFLGSERLPPPGLVCGLDPTPDVTGIDLGDGGKDLGCEVYPNPQTGATCEEE